MAKKKQDGTHSEKKVYRNVQEFFAQEELVDKAKAISAARTEMESLRAEAKTEADKFKSAINAKETEIGLLCDQITLGYEMVQKEVMLVLNMDKTVREYWLDGQIIETEPLREEDYQAELSLNDSEEEDEA